MLAAVAGVATITLLVVSAAPALSSRTAVDQGSPTLSARPLSKMLGVVPAARGGATNPHRPTAQEFAGTILAAGGNLVYHGGSVLRTNQAYAIYWGSTGSTYRSLINGFLQNVAGDSGKTTNVYASDTQYSDGSGSIAYASGYGGAFVDTTTVIPDHCSGQYAGSGLTVTGCVTDADIETEVLHAIAAAGWTAGPGKVFFVLTPRNVGSCFDTTSGVCAYSYYCAYHSNFYDSRSTDVFYANQPYTDTSGVGAAGVCDTGQHPNNDFADATINVLSHEHNEAITDPNGDAWYDSAGNENGDKCAWNFGTQLGSTAFGAYNQAIGTGKYYLQQEWSNASSSCVLTFGGVVVQAPTVTGFTPHKGPVGQSVAITGTNFTGTTAVKFNGTSASFTVNSASSVTATVPTGATTGLVSVTTPGGTATSSINFKVQAPLPPTITSLTPGKGHIGQAVTVTGTGFTGVSAVKFNGTSATFPVVSATSITTTAPVGATTGPVTVTTAAGTATSPVNFRVR